MQNNERTYRFIDDPAHKENLSGRVTAACLNCRRKKVKCSGEASCQQCHEKGLVCEGPPSRKRPKREHVSPMSREMCSLNDQTQHGKGKRDSLQQQQQPAKLPNEDSGYSSIGGNSWRASSQGRTSPQVNGPSNTATTLSSMRIQTHTAPGVSTSGTFALPITSSARSTFTSPLAFNTSVPGYHSVNDESPSTTSTEDWSFVAQSSRFVHEYYKHPTAPSDSSQGTHANSAAMSTGSIDFTRRNSNDWWSASGNAQSSNNLIAAAEALEGQAQSLRRLASRRNSPEGGFSPPHPASRTQPTGTTGTALQDTFFDPGFDASAFIRSDGTLRSGLTPGAHDYGTWWGINGTSQPGSMPTGGYTTSRADEPVSGIMSRQPVSQAQGSAASLSMPGRRTQAPGIRQEMSRYPSNTGD